MLTFMAIVASMQCDKLHVTRASLLAYVSGACIGSGAGVKVGSIAPSCNDTAECVINATQSSFTGNKATSHGALDISGTVRMQVQQCYPVQCPQNPVSHICGA